MLLIVQPLRLASVDQHHSGHEHSFVDCLNVLLFVDARAPFPLSLCSLMTSRLYLLAGCTYQLNVEDLRRFPGLIFHDALHMRDFYDPQRGVFCLTRNRVFFEVLLFYIQHGILSRPIDLPLVSERGVPSPIVVSLCFQDLFSEELE